MTNAKDKSTTDNFVLLAVLMLAGFVLMILNKQSGWETAWMVQMPVGLFLLAKGYRFLKNFIQNIKFADARKQIGTFQLTLVLFFHCSMVFIGICMIAEGLACLFLITENKKLAQAVALSLI